MDSENIKNDREGSGVGGRWKEQQEGGLVHELWGAKHNEQKKKITRNKKKVKKFEQEQRKIHENNFVVSHKDILKWTRGSISQTLEKLRI